MKHIAVFALFVFSSLLVFGQKKEVNRAINISPPTNYLVKVYFSKYYPTKKVEAAVAARGYHIHEYAYHDFREYGRTSQGYGTIIITTPELLAAYNREQQELRRQEQKRRDEIGMARAQALGVIIGHVADGVAQAVDDFKKAPAGSESTNVGEAYQITSGSNNCYVSFTPWRYKSVTIQVTDGGFISPAVYQK